MILDNIWAVPIWLIIPLQKLLSVHYSEVHGEETSGEILPGSIDSDYNIWRPAQPSDTGNAARECWRNATTFCVNTRADGRARVSSRAVFSDGFSHEQSQCCRLFLPTGANPFSAAAVSWLWALARCGSLHDSQTGAMSLSIYISLSLSLIVCTNSSNLILFWLVRVLIYVLLQLNPILSLNFFS